MVVSFLGIPRQCGQHHQQRLQHQPQPGQLCHRLLLRAVGLRRMEQPQLRHGGDHQSQEEFAPLHCHRHPHGDHLLPPGQHLLPDGYVPQRDGHQRSGCCGTYRTV